MKESTSSDSFSDAMNNMLNEGDIPSFMKKIMGKEKSTSAKNGTESMATPEEVDAFVKEEEELINRCDNAVKELETGLEKKTLPFFVRPMAKQLISNLKSIRSKAESRLSELRNPEAKSGTSEMRSEIKSGKNSEAGEGKAEAGKATANEATTKKATETGSTGETAKEAQYSEKPKSGSSQSEDVMSEFMKTLKKNFTGDNNVCSWKEGNV